MAYGGCWLTHRLINRRTGPNHSFIPPNPTQHHHADELYPNAHVCPALRDVEREAYASREWAQVQESDWVRHLNKRMAEELPGYDWDHMLDCLGTTSCTGRWSWVLRSRIIPKRSWLDLYMHLKQTEPTTNLFLAGCIP